MKGTELYLLDCFSLSQQLLCSSLSLHPRGQLEQMGALSRDPRSHPPRDLADCTYTTLSSTRDASMSSCVTLITGSS